MEFLEMYSFFVNITCLSTKLILKNGKSMASIAIITHSLLSIIMFLFRISIKSLVYDMDDHSLFIQNPTSTSSQDTFLPHMLVYIALLVLAELAFIFAFVAISHISSVATILLSAASYTHDKNISSRDFFPMIAKKWKRPCGSPTQPARYSVLVVFFAVVLSVVYPNALTFSISLPLGMIAAIFVMYSSVSWILAMVVSVVEEGCLGKEALEKGEQLAKGHRMHGFLLNIFFSLLVVIPFLGCLWIFGDKVALDFPFFGLVIMNIFTLVKMLATVEYTILYFRCKKCNGRESEDFGDLQYAKLPSDDRACRVSVPR